MDSQLRRVADRLGLDPDGEPIAVRPGLGGNELWRLPVGAGHEHRSDVLLRLFPVGYPSIVAQREAAVQTVAAAYGVSTPAILGCDRIDDRPVLAIEWVDGPLVSERLWAGDDAGQLGHRCGSVLAALHQIDPDRIEPGRIDSDHAAELDAVLAGRDWIDWAGPRADRVRELTADLPVAAERRLLHLDFHPENLVLTNDAVVVLDWANTRIGPPAADLARVASIVDLIHDHPGLDARARTAIVDFGSGLLAGYAEAGGDIEIPEPILAWAAAVQLIDLTADWVPADYRERQLEIYRSIAEDDVTQSG